MDDDDDDTGDIAATLDGGSRSSGSRRQGEYQLPTLEAFWTYGT